MGILGQREADDPTGDSVSGRFGSVRRRLRGAVVSRVTRLRRRLGRIAAASRRYRSLGETPDEPPADGTAGRYPRIDGFPDRDQPLTYPGRDCRGINPPDVVGIRTNGGLRVSLPENPDATLTSDVWTEVEP